MKLSLAVVMLLCICLCLTGVVAVLLLHFVGVMSLACLLPCREVVPLLVQARGGSPNTSLLRLEIPIPLSLLQQDLPGL